MASPLLYSSGPSEHNPSKFKGKVHKPAPLNGRSNKEFAVVGFFLNVYLFIERERERESTGEPDEGLKLMNHEIMT